MLSPSTTIPPPDLRVQAIREMKESPDKPRSRKYEQSPEARGSRDVMSRDVMSRDVMSRDVMSRGAASSTSPWNNTDKEVMQMNTFIGADLEETEINMFREVFNMYDKDGNNSIDCKELNLILEELGYDCTEEEVEAVIQKFDCNSTGTIDFNEFLIFIGDWISNDENQIRDAFEVFDKEGNGYLSLDQLKRALTMYGEAFTDEEAEEFFSEIDVDGDGTITADEFILYIKGIN